MLAKRELWNEQQKKLRHLCTRADEHQHAIELFLTQHALVHTAAMAQTELETFADEIWADMTAETFRCVPRGAEHSVAWCIWHIARIEDVTMNLLVADSAQILHGDNWLARLQAPIQHTGNAMSGAEVTDLSMALDMGALRAYRVAVGRRTREVVQQLQPGELKQKVSPARIQRVRDEGAVLADAEGVIAYWSNRDIAGLLLMPPTRHNFVHLSEALRLKRKWSKIN